MWTAILTAFATMLGKVALSYLESKTASDAANAKAVTDAENTTLQDITVVADAQAANNAVERGTAADVAARLRQQLNKSGSDGDNPSGTTG